MKPSLLVDAIIGFPKYALAFLLGFVVVLTDPDMTGIAIIGVLIGILIAPLWGLLAFFVLWQFFRQLRQAARESHS